MDAFYSSSVQWNLDEWPVAPCIPLTVPKIRFRHELYADLRNFISRNITSSRNFTKSFFPLEIAELPFVRILIWKFRDSLFLSPKNFEISVTIISV